MLGAQFPIKCLELNAVYLLSDVAALHFKYQNI